MSLLSCHDVSKSYRQADLETVVLSDINLTIEPAEVAAITGPSGSGKSTLLNLIGLLDVPTRGEMYLNDLDVAKLSEDERSRMRCQAIGFIFQQFFLLPRLTILENVLLPSVYAKKNLTQRGLELLENVGVLEHKDKYPAQLSGGQQQRVAIARALLNSPALVLADEPTGALDSKTSQAVMEILLTLNRTESTSIIIVTHDAAVAAQCDRQIQLMDGKIVA